MKARGSDRLLRVVFAFAWFDLGLLILVLPWSHLWESNSLLTRYPDLIPFVLNGYVRGAISGVGLLDLVMAADALLGHRQPPIASRD